MSEPNLEELVRERIRTLRRDKGLTQEALCERAGISLDSVNRIEGGSRVPTLDTLERIARALDVSPSDLLRTTKPPRPALAASVARIVALIEREPAEVQETLEEVVRAVLRTLRQGSKRKPRTRSTAAG